MKKLVVMFTCVGRRVALVRSFRQACRQLDVQGVMVGTDSTENSAALQGCDRKYVVKRVSEPATWRRTCGSSVAKVWTWWCPPWTWTCRSGRRHGSGCRSKAAECWCRAAGGGTVPGQAADV